MCSLETNFEQIDQIDEEHLCLYEFKVALISTTVDN